TSSIGTEPGPSSIGSTSAASAASCTDGCGAGSGGATGVGCDGVGCRDSERARTGPLASRRYGRLVSERGRTTGNEPVAVVAENEPERRSVGSGIGGAIAS